MKKEEVTPADFSDDKRAGAEVRGAGSIPEPWVVFAPFSREDPPPVAIDRRSVPDRITVAGRTVAGVHARPERGQLDLAPWLGDMPRCNKVAWVVADLPSDAPREFTLGLGADWWLQAWVNGGPVLDTMEQGNRTWPPAINDHCVTVPLEAGSNLLAVRVVSGMAPSTILAIGGPDDLRAGDFRTILHIPPPPDWAELCRSNPADTDAPIRWVTPEHFAYDEPGLGLPALDGVEHVETFVPRRSAAPADEGGSGVYEGVEYGMFNHNSGLAVFRDRLISLWVNHAFDEDAPGGRMLGRVGRALDDEGRIAWDEPGSLIEPAPAPVEVRRVRRAGGVWSFDRERIRDIYAGGAFCRIEDRLFFIGGFTAMHGLSTDVRYHLGGERPVPDEAFSFEPRGRSWPIYWSGLGLRFCQEWDVRDGRFQAVSPLYREGEAVAELALTPTLTMPLAELTPVYRNAPPLAQAPEEMQRLIREGKRTSFVRHPRYQPGTSHLAVDGHNGLAHRAEFQRPDGTWVVVRDNLKPDRQDFYYAAEKATGEDFYPPARRTNLFGAVQPAAGEWPGYGVFIAGNSRDRRNLFLTVSRDGRVFDRTWNLLYRSLQNVTPGYAKAQGGTGAGPQYTQSAILGRSLWLLYSISKERMGATRVPLDAIEAACR